MHQSVLLKESIGYLNCTMEGTFVDCTAGAGGHSLEIIRNSPESTRLVCLDVDNNALTICKERLAPFVDRVTFCRSNFKNLKAVLEDIGVGKVSGILADLGVSSMQLDRAERGFSFGKEGPLDMRMDDRITKDAGYLVNNLSESELVSILFRYGEERYSRRIASKIISYRNKKEIVGTMELANLIKSVVPKSDINPATRTFQALRIAVNGELDGLDNFIEDAVDCLEAGGRLVMISFHSLEDRVVKQTLKKLESSCSCPKELPQCLCNKKSTVKILTKKPVRATDCEVSVNVRSRSAKLRAAEKVI